MTYYIGRVLSIPFDEAVATIDPVASMQAIDNPDLKKAAEKVREKLERAVSQV